MQKKRGKSGGVRGLACCGAGGTVERPLLRAEVDKVEEGQRVTARDLFSPAELTDFCLEPWH